MKPLCRFLLSVTLAVVFALNAAAQTQTVFTSYSSLDGLAHNNISHIYTDSRGFVWLSTWCGVSRFDGYSFRNFCVNLSDGSVVQQNRFVNVLEDGLSNLWFRTYDNRIYRFNRSTEQFEDIVGSPDALGDCQYKAGNVLAASNGDVWIEIEGKGVLRVIDRQGRVSVENCFDLLPASGSVQSITEDSEGRVWIVCDGDRIFCFDQRSGFEEVTTAREPVIATVVRDRSVCFATSHSVCSISEGKVVDVPLNNDAVTALCADSVSGKLYAGLRSGLIVTVDSDGYEAVGRGGAGGRVRSIVSDSHGLLWITTPEAGITRCDPRSGSFKHFSQRYNTVSYYSDTTTMVVERNDVVWIKMNMVGFGYYDRESDEVMPFYNDPSQPDCRTTNGVSYFTVDSDNVLWYTPNLERGLQRAIIQAGLTDRVPFADGAGAGFNGEVRALMTDRDGNYWLGTKGGTLYCYDRNRRLVETFPKEGWPPLGLIYTLLQDSEGNIWVGTKGDGLICMRHDSHGWTMNRFRNDPNDEWSISNNQIYSLAQDDCGRIWIATWGGGINMIDSPASTRFHTPQNSFPGYPIEHADRARYVLFDTPQRMLVGTTENLLVFNPSLDGEMIRFDIVKRDPQSANSLESSNIIHIFKDSSSRVWLSTFGGGLSLVTGYDSYGLPQFESFTTEQGLPSNVVYATTEDRHGNLWLATEGGAVRFDPQSRLMTLFTQYDGIEPALYSEAAAITTPDGEIMFGGVRNLHVLDPDHLPATDYDYKLQFTGFQIRNSDVAVGDDQPLDRSITETDRIRLPYDYLLFRIEFSSLNFRIRDHVNYMYMLEGYDDQWNLSHNIGSAFYSKVPHGRYTFRVKAYLNNEAVSGGEISVAVSIQAPPWLRWWAWTIYVLLFAALLWGIYAVMFTMARLRSQAKVEKDMTEMKLRFFTNISHELRTPLTLIMGGIDDARRRENLTERGEQSLDLAGKNAKRMLTLINQILDFRKVVGGKMELHISRCDIVALAQNAMTDFRETATERRIALLFTVSHQQLPLWIDEERMECVVYNLLSNAFKFTPDGGTIRISIWQRTGNDFAVISVSDNGIGITKEHQNTIFDRFSSYSRSVGTDVKGSGIGLALCKEIVTLHHGTITVDSRVGEGSTFNVSLPVGNSHFDMEQIDFARGSEGDRYSYLVSDFTPQSAADCATENESPSSAQTILLVDDNREMRAFIRNHLIDTYSVVEAADGVEALSKIAELQPDIIVTDLMMPRMDGIELTERVRNNFETSHIPIIMLTARHTPEDRIKAMRFGADGYITKPFSIDLLLVRIDNLLTQRHRLFEKFSSAGESVGAGINSDNVVVTDRDGEFVRSVIGWIDQNIEKSDLTIDDLAQHLNLGRTTMYNKLKSLTGKSPVELIKEYRLGRAERLLRSEQYSVSEVAYRVGFSDPGYFSRCFKEHYKMPPAEYLRSFKSKG